MILMYLCVIGWINDMIKTLRKVLLAFLYLFTCLFAKGQEKYNKAKAMADFRHVLNKPKTLQQQLEWNGYFDYGTNSRYHSKIAYWQHNEDKDTLVCENPVFFFKNGLAVMTSINFYGMNAFRGTISSPAILNKYRSSFEWGTFEVNNDTINAFFFHNYSEATSKLFSNFGVTRYMGFIKNKDTITNWMPVPPYKYINGIYTLPEVLFFRQFNEKTLIDSSKAWVNRYRY